MRLFSRVTRHASCALLVLVTSSVAGESAPDWQDALHVIRQVALNTSEAEEHRADAVLAYAKVQMGRGQHDEALKLCQEILKSAGDKAAVAEAALRAGGLVERCRHGHLRAELAFLSPWAGGAQGHAAYGMTQELNRATYMLGVLAARPMVPAPVVPRAPHWADASPGKAPAVLNLPPLAAPPPRWYPASVDAAPGALRVTLPRFEAPSWHARLTFPPLKEPR
ncbi:MAG TPA: hypothetical protein VNE39_22425 [Planctomycetota bacterium]|nr:hypothetical protein [Planctomycetota bacterium]